MGDDARRRSAGGRLVVLLPALLFALPLSAERDPRRLMPQAAPQFDGTGAALSGRGGCDQLAAAAAAGQPLTVSAWADLALCRNPDTGAAWAGVRAAAAGTGVARAEQFPEITGSIGGTAGGSVLFTLPGADFAATSSGFAGLSVGWLVTDFGGRRSRIAAAEAERVAALASFAGVAQQTVFAAAVSANRVLAQEAVLAAARANEEFARNTRDAAAERERVGAGLRVDRLQADAALAEAELLRRRAEGDLSIARARLAIDAGLPATVPAAVAGTEIPADAGLVAAAAADLIATAERQRPDVRLAEARRDARLAALGVARAQRRPAITLNATPAVTVGGSLGDNAQASVGATMTVPLFDGFGRLYNVRRAESDLDRSEAELAAARQAAALEVWSAQQQLETDLANLATARRRFASADEAAQLALGRFRAGVGTITDLLNAQSSLAASRRELATAELDVRSRQIELALAIGDVERAFP